MVSINFVLKYIIYTLLVFILFASYGCNNKDNINTPESQNRIKGKESTIYKNINYYIIEVDSIEYLCSNSGICPLVRKNVNIK